MQKKRLELAEFSIIKEFVGSESNKIYLVEKKGTGDKFIYKIIKILNLPNQLREIQAQKNLKHKFIVELIDYSVDKDNINLLIEYAGGGDLFDFINSLDSILESRILKLFYKIVVAVDFIHSNGFIHRDLKPENILIGDDMQPKLADFGSSVSIEKVRNTFCGTFEYMAPEIYQRSLQSEKVDIWALGVLLFEMTHNKVPFTQNKVQEIREVIDNRALPYNPQISLRIRGIIEKILKIDPEQRPSTREILLFPELRVFAKGLCPQLESKSGKEQFSSGRYKELMTEKSYSKEVRWKCGGGRAKKWVRRGGLGGRVEKENIKKDLLNFGKRFKLDGSKEKKKINLNFYKKKCSNKEIKEEKGSNRIVTSGLLRRAKGKFKKQKREKKSQKKNLRGQIRPRIFKGEMPSFREKKKEKASPVQGGRRNKLGLKNKLQDIKSKNNHESSIFSNHINKHKLFKLKSKPQVEAKLKAANPATFGKKLLKKKVKLKQNDSFLKMGKLKRCVPKLKHDKHKLRIESLQIEHKIQGMSGKKAKIISLQNKKSFKHKRVVMGKNEFWNKSKQTLKRKADQMHRDRFGLKGRLRRKPVKAGKIMSVSICNLGQKSTFRTNGSSKFRTKKHVNSFFYKKQGKSNQKESFLNIKRRLKKPGTSRDLTRWKVGVGCTSLDLKQSHFDIRQIFLSNKNSFLKDQKPAEAKNTSIEKKMRHGHSNLSPVTVKLFPDKKQYNSSRHPIYDPRSSTFKASQSLDFKNKFLFRKFVNKKTSKIVPFSLRTISFNLV